MEVESKDGAYEYMRVVLMLNAPEYGYRKFSLAWESEEDKDSPRALRLADFAGVSYLVGTDNWIDDDFMEWLARSQFLGDSSLCMNVALWIALLDSHVAETFLDDIEEKQERKWIINRLYKTLGIDTGVAHLRRRLMFCDGESLSVQASAEHYAIPKDDDGPYTHVEVGFPTFVDPRLLPFAQDEKDPLDCSYHFVPVTLLADVIKEHGGVLDGELPPMKGLK